MPEKMPRRCQAARSTSARHQLMHAGGRRSRDVLRTVQSHLADTTVPSWVGSILLMAGLAIYVFACLGTDPSGGGTFLGGAYMCAGLVLFAVHAEIKMRRVRRSGEG